MGAMAQLVKQVLTWHLTNGNAHDCVQAMVCFKSEGSALGAKAICYLSHDSSGTADGVVIALNGCDPRMKYTGRSKPTKKQVVKQNNKSHQVQSQIIQSQQISSNPQETSLNINAIYKIIYHIFFSTHLV